MPQNKLILQYLKDGGKLTGLEALRLFGTMKLASRVSELRDEGHDIKSKTIMTRNGKHVSEYWMPTVATANGQLEMCVSKGEYHDQQ